MVRHAFEVPSRLDRSRMKMENSPRNCRKAWPDWGALRALGPGSDLPALPDGDAAAECGQRAESGGVVPAVWTARHVLAC
jgi:hypothetical protein